jgi:hypothetical protein
MGGMSGEKSSFGRGKDAPTTEGSSTMLSLDSALARPVARSEGPSLGDEGGLKKEERREEER